MRSGSIPLQASWKGTQEFGILLKTYRDDNHGFELKYPDDVYAVEKLDPKQAYRKRNLSLEGVSIVFLIAGSRLEDLVSGYSALARDGKSADRGAEHGENER